MRNLIYIKNKLFLGGLSGLKCCLVIFRSMNVLFFFLQFQYPPPYSNLVAKDVLVAMLN